MLSKALLGAGLLASALPHASALPWNSHASTSRLYVSTYAGTVSTLSLHLSPVANSTNGTRGALQSVQESKACSGNSSWLELDVPNKVLYCLDEGWTSSNSTLFSFKTSPEGKLTELGKSLTVPGAVSTVRYAGGKAMAVASYGGSGLASFNISDPAAITQLQADVWKLDKKMPNPERQEAPHPHQAIMDPTGEYLLVPDLGADLVRVFTVDNTTLKYTPTTPLEAAPGSGPRHVTFLVTGGKTYMYLITELANTITGFEVHYMPNKTLHFAQVYMSGTHGKENKVPDGAAGAEILITPDQQFLIVSSRLENSFTIPNFDTKNSTEMLSDSIITFAINHDTGDLSTVQRYPSGGRVPRQFTINKAGDLLGVGLQGDDRVVVIDRDVKTGHLKGFAANINMPGDVTTVLFDE